MVDVIDVARKLVMTKSVSGMERDIAYLIRDLLGEYGVDDAFIDDYGNVIGVLRGGIDRIIVFEGHMDHVPEGDVSQWKYDPYSAVIVNDKLYGRGSVDMKSAIAAMITSISSVRGKDHPTIYYVFVPFEEISEGTLFRYALEDTLKIKPDLVVLGEATKLNIHRGHRGRSVWRIRLRGRSAHAAMPDKGVNPLIALSRFINELLEKETPTHPILGRSTWSPTIVDCTPKSTPMIPDNCELIIDYRMNIYEDMNSIRGFFENSLKKLLENKMIIGYDVNVNRGEAVLWTGRKITYIDYYPSWLIEDTDFLSKMRDIVSKINPGAGIGIWRFSTDGVYSAGVRKHLTIGIGPGDEALAHQPNEYVSVKEVLLAEKIYSEIATRIGSILQ
jgi:putative selenium metabolism hydrolase